MALRFAQITTLRDKRRALAAAAGPELNLMRARNQTLRSVRTAALCPRASLRGALPGGPAVGA
jgi:hypothetical protein